MLNDNLVFGLGDENLQRTESMRQSVWMNDECVAETSIVIVRTNHDKPTPA